MPSLHYGHSLSREVVIEALERAQRLNLVSVARPPRVRISNYEVVYLSVALSPYGPPKDRLHLQVERIDGTVKKRIWWPEDKAATKILFEAQQAIRAVTGEEEVDVVEPLLYGLADLLEAAFSYPERRPAVELCPPQWMVCERAVVTSPGAPSIDVTVDELRGNPRLRGDVTEKPWVDADSWQRACTIALLLYPEDTAQF